MNSRPHIWATVSPIAVALATLSIFVVSPARSERLTRDEQSGLTILHDNCSRCHAIGKTGDSPLKSAPPFRTLHTRYPVESLEESLGEGIITGHPAMPEFHFDPDQVGQIIAYMKTLER
ncbi:MAG: cytochrome c [Xanthobacteraceae bacterium]